MNKLFQQLLQQAGSRVLPQAQRAVQGFADDLVAPVLRGITTKANPGAAKAQLVRSVGAIEDALVRPVTRFGQEALANPLTGIPRTFIPGGVARDLVRQTVGSRAPFLMPPTSSNNLRYTADPAQRFLQEFGRTFSPAAGRTAASLRPGPSAAAFPLDDTLRLLQGRGQYLQRQAQGAFGALQTGIGQIGGMFRNLQGLGPTALNPLATRNPTTKLGKLGKAFNPLNPLNLVDMVNPAPGITVGARLASGLGLTGAAGLGTSVAGGLAGFGALEALFPRGTADGTLVAATERGDFTPQIRRQDTQGFTDQGILGALAPPPPTLPPPTRDPGLQAGQFTAPPGAPPAPGVVSNGAGDPRKRQNVQQRQLSQEVLNAAQQYAAPTGVPLSSFYAGQQQLGRRMEQGGELQRQLKDLGGAAGMSDQALMDWAKANPGLAYRELLKLKERSSDQ